MSLRLRFAPSPTGYLHVGGARTALFNWLLARKEGGVFVLRIEDTDRERSSEEHTRAILHGLEWLGLDWDEGPVFQSDGLARHQADANRLLEAGAAYRDFTAPEELRVEAERRGLGDPSRLARERAEAMGTREAERRAEAGEAHAVRFRVPDGAIGWEDLVHGGMRFESEDVDDFVVLRSDGTPTYNMAVVSDDAHAAITHVIRGDDHLSNTPKQILLYEALGLPVPTFGHVPMILGSDGKRLSKRHGATAVGAYEERGILPVAMTNFLALLGWNPGDEREVMAPAELVEAFSMDRVLKKSAVFDMEKLEWLNGQHMARTPAEELAPLAAARLGEDHGIEPGELGRREAWFHHLVDLLKVRNRTVAELAEQAVPFVDGIPSFDEKAVRKHWEKDPSAAVERLERLRERLGDCTWEKEPLETELRALAEEMGLGAGKLIHPLRLAPTEEVAHPDPDLVHPVRPAEGRVAQVAHASVHADPVGPPGQVHGQGHPP